MGGSTADGRQAERCPLAPFEDVYEIRVDSLREWCFGTYFMGYDDLQLDDPHRSNDHVPWVSLLAGPQ
ncbi:hypothetical protein D9M70_440910 [compost metagenome]